MSEGDAFREAREEMRLNWMGENMLTKHRILEIQNDLEVTQELFKQTRVRQVKRALNNLRYLMIKEKNLLGNHGKDDWRDF